MKATSDARKARLAAALRENLKRRKAAARQAKPEGAKDAKTSASKTPPSAS